MLSATELYALTPLLKGILWVEVIVYLGIGVYEILDDFRVKPQSWMTLGSTPNSYLMIKEKVGHKMHGGLCFLLGFIALNGLIEGAVTRFELEICFVSLGLLMMTIWMTLMPGRLGLTVVLTKPEFWLQILMFGFFLPLIQTWVVGLCLGLNLWGVLVNVLHTRRQVLAPFSYQTLRRDAIEAGLGERELRSFDTLAGHKPE
ncbi:MAG: hypothetical protein P8N63_08790 [Pseudomonadales bacterium]|nr:hypothetical protein [Pseudomonadales bacterium]